MALFFDAAWFDARLEDRGLSRQVLAAASGMRPDELALVFKDQRELSSAEVRAFAELLGVTAAEIADHAGIATPHRAGPVSLETRLAAIEQRLAAIEARLARL